MCKSPVTSSTSTAPRPAGWEDSPCEVSSVKSSIRARNTFYPVPTLDVLRVLYDELPAITDQAYFDDNPYASVFDIRKAKRLLGWVPQSDWKNPGQWEF